MFKFIRNRRLEKKRQKAIQKARLRKAHVERLKHSNPYVYDWSESNTDVSSK